MRENGQQFPESLRGRASPNDGAVRRKAGRCVRSDARRQGFGARHCSGYIHQSLPKTRLECFRGERQECERAWLTSIAVNLCKNERKKSWFRFIDRKTPIDALNLPTEDAPQEKMLMYMVVQTLPQKDCELILLRFYQKLTVAEISKILHRSPATIYRGLEHAHRLLKKALERM